MPVSAETRRILLEAVVILVLGVVLGLSFNYRLVMNAFSGAPAAPAATGEAPADSRYPVPADLEEVRQLVRDGAVPVDARAREIYDEGHIPSARSLPLGETAEMIDSFRQAVSLDTIIVVYCSGYGCPDSFDLGVRLLAEGYMDVRVFEGGYPEWRDAGLPVEGGTP
jgi:rhodanese-related sulfurtransferase